MKTTASKSSIQNLEEVLQRFINNKNTFSLTEEENEMLKENLFELLSKVYDNYQLACIDINQIWDLLLYFHIRKLGNSRQTKRKYHCYWLRTIYAKLYRW